MADCVIPEGYKETALGVIPKEWAAVRMHDVCTLINGRAYKQNELLSQGKYKVLRVGNFFTNDSWYFSDLELDANKYACKGDLLYAWSASFGPRFWTGDKVIYHYHIWKICDLRGINQQYLYFFLDYDASLLQGATQGGTMRHITKENMERKYLPLPPLEEQRKIAEVLNVWDKAIEKQTQLIEKLELRKKGLMQQLLTGKKRLPGFSGEWKKVKLGEIGIFFKGFGVSKDEIKSYERYKCLTYGDIYTKYEIKIENVRSFISQDVANISKQIQYGDICFASSGETAKDIGKCAVFVDGSIGYAGGDIIIFRNKTNVNPITLAYILNSEEVNKQKSSLGQGHSVVHIYISNLEKITIKIPDIEEQNAIAEIFTSCDKEIYLANQELKSLHQQKKGLMQVLLTGKKRVKQ